jgi:hypothetical protein
MYAYPIEDSTMVAALCDAGASAPIAARAAARIRQLGHRHVVVMRDARRLRIPLRQHVAALIAAGEESSK